MTRRHRVRSTRVTARIFVVGLGISMKGALLERLEDK
jgi:hypothetical protein